MYLKLAGEQDKQMTENWKGDADGVLVFVSCHSMCATFTRIGPEPVDWFIFCLCHGIPCVIRPGPQAEFPGHVSVLHRKNV